MSVFLWWTSWWCPWCTSPLALRLLWKTAPILHHDQYAVVKNGKDFFFNWWDKMKIAESEQTHEGSYIRYRNALKAFCTLYEKIEGTVLWMCFSPFCYSNLSVQLCQHTAKSKNMIKKATPPKLLCSKLLTFGVISPSPEMQSAVTIPVAQALKAQLCAQTLTQRGLDTDSNYRVKAFLEILPYCLFVAARKH